ncbi:MAG: serine protease [Candidatus Kerfeldbacteria bacterium]|nr:serine protease [Candidatus Kerfeldbacteria bacterium]
MKPRDVPTSPKTRNLSAIDRLFRAEPTISQPIVRSTGTLLTVVVTVALSIGGMAALTWAAERFPNVGWLGLWRRSAAPAERVVIREAADTRPTVDQVASKVTPSLGTLLRGRASDIRPPSDRFGLVTVLTSDGVGVTVDAAPDGVQLLARIAGGVSRDVSAAATDPATGISLVRMPGSSNPLAVADLDRLDLARDFYVIKYDPAAGVSTVPARIVSSRDRALASQQLDALVESSEVVSRRLRIDLPLSDSWKGAALVDRDGQLVGIVESAGSSDGALVVAASWFKQQLTRFGRGDGIIRSVLGVTYVDLAYAVAKEDLPTKGAYLVARESPRQPAVALRSPAAAAGLRAADVITAVESVPVNELRGLAEILAGYEAGAEVTLSIWRGGQELTLKTRLGQAQS